MTVPARAGNPTVPATGQSADSDAGLAEAVAAAVAAAEVLPSGAHLTVGTPTRDPQSALLTGQAAAAGFAGTAQGDLVVVVAQDLVDAMADTPLGALDLAKAVQPALVAAAATFGPGVVDPAVVLDPADAVATLAAGGAAVYVPLLDGGVVRAALAVLVTTRPTAPRRAPQASAAGGRAGLELLHDVEMEVTAELGRTRMIVRDLLSLAPGTIVELDRVAGSPSDLLVNGRPIARGEVVIIDEHFGLRITEVIAPGDRPQASS